MAISNIPVEIFSTYIINKLHRTNPFLAYAVNESASVLGGAVVHIPQAGASPAVVKNRSTFPATAVRRADSFVNYPLNVFSTDPTHITWHEENEISYDKTDSVLNDHVATLMEAVGDDMLYNWAKDLPASSVIMTTGAEVAVTEPGQTGTRKAFTYKELQKAQAMMNKQLVPKTDRYVVLESYMLQQLIDSLSANQMAAFQQTADLANGVVGKLAGFTILERGQVIALTAAGAVKAPGEAIAATDCLGAVAWQKDSVAVAYGDIKPFQETDSPTYYGDIFSALVKSGGRCRRGDNKGVVIIAQGTDAESETPTISGDDALSVAATAGSNVRTYATSNGAGVTAETDAEWLTVAADGNKVTFTRTAYAHDAEGEDPRVATVIVGIEGTEVTKTVTVSQAKASE